MSTSTMNSLNLTLEPLLPVCHYAYDNYLSKSYTDTEITWDWVLNTAHGSIERPNHGLAHTMRVAQMVYVVTNFLSAHHKNQGFDLDIRQIQLLQIAALFSVVGRENDMGFSDNPEKYMQCRLKSAQAFETFAKRFLKLSTTELQHYTHIVYKMGNPTEQSPEFKILNFAHKLDLLRCYSTSQIEKSIVEPLNEYLPESETQKLLDYAEDLLHATGDRVYVGKNPQEYNKELFFNVSTNAKACLEALATVEMPKPRPISSALTRLGR